MQSNWDLLHNKIRTYCVSVPNNYLMLRNMNISAREMFKNFVTELIPFLNKLFGYTYNYKHTRSYVSLR